MIEYLNEADVDGGVLNRDPCRDRRGKLRRIENAARNPAKVASALGRLELRGG